MKQSLQSAASENLEVFIDAARLQTRVKELAQEISRDYEGKELMLVGVLKGCFLFMADLCRYIDLPLECDFLGLSSYGMSTETSGVVRITSDLTRPVQGKDILVVEDIVDTGLTMSFLMDNLMTKKPNSVRVCTLLEKPDNMRVKVDLDYIGFSVPNRFVVGYGLDYAEKYRNLPYIGVVRQVGD